VPRATEVDLESQRAFYWLDSFAYVSHLRRKVRASPA